MTNSPASGESLELLITKTVVGGDGFAVREGKVYFVEGALPGEKILARVFEDKKNFARARVVQILTPSTHRIEPPCHYASHCGGCQYQHVEYAEELRLKEAQLAETLQSIPVPPERIRPIVASPIEFGYRNSVTLHPIFSKKGKANAAMLGFIGKDNISKIPIKNCLLTDVRFSAIFGQEILLKKDTEKITFKLSDKGELVPDTKEIFFRVEMGGESFLTSSKGFFQNNLRVASLLAERVAKWTHKAASQAFFDLYAGVGTFSILCAKEAPKIICIEESAPSVQAMRMNREEKKIAAMEVVEGRVEKLFPEVWEKYKAENSLILLDPPRQGMAPELVRFLSKIQGAHSLVYISCDPVTLARDLKTMLNPGHWRVDEVAPFDMFPRTKHLEVAAFLTNISPSQN